MGKLRSLVLVVLVLAMLAIANVGSVQARPGVVPPPCPGCYR